MASRNMTMEIYKVQLSLINSMNPFPDYFLSVCNCNLVRRANQFLAPLMRLADLKGYGEPGRSQLDATLPL